MKIYWNFYPQAIQDLGGFVSSSEQIWRNLQLYNLLTSVSSAVNGCRQNENLRSCSYFWVNYAFKKL